MLTAFGGERGIRTPGPVTVNGFQDRRIRPLCHLSGVKIYILDLFERKKIKFTNKIYKSLCSVDFRLLL